MCGLSVIVDSQSDAGLLTTLLAMHAQIPFRGPDGEGFSVAGSTGDSISAGSESELRGLAGSMSLRIGFAFRWLQIQDRNPVAAQPMRSKSGAVQLLFNGEIYNFRELRQELGILGHGFSSDCDTEVVLAAYSQWGCGMFRRLNGMWSIVILDLDAGKLTISRDRFGIKPLYYHQSGTRLLVASEVKQILAAGVCAKADLSSVARFVHGQRPSSPEQTFFATIAAQPPSTYAEIDLRQPSAKPQFTSYWDLAVPAQGSPGSQLTDAALQALDDRLAESVAEHMVACVPVGVLVSGGLDSSIIAALAARTFSAKGESGIGISMVVDRSESSHDESAHINRVVAALGYRGFATQLTPSWIRENINRVTWAQEEPVAGIAAAGQYLVYELAAKHGLRVVLDGQGADELFGGYPRHQMAFLRDCVRRFALFDLAMEACALLRRDPGFFRHVWLTSVVPRWRKLVATRFRSKIDFMRDLADIPGIGKCQNSPRKARNRNLAETLRNDVVAGNLRTVLALTDRNAMAHSIEARVPYVDRRIVEFAFLLPDRCKISAGQRKRLLRLLGARYLPLENTQRLDRIGFGAPVHQWLLRDFRSDLATLPDSPIFSESILFDRPALRRFVDGFLSGSHADCGTIWRIYAVGQWARAYGVKGL